MKRLGLFALLAVITTGCGGASRGMKPTSVAASTQACAQAPASGMTCRSPDGAWTVRFYSGPGTLWLARRGGGPSWVKAYRSHDACCAEITWAKPHTLLFDDDYRLFHLDPATRRHMKVAGWSTFVVSPDGRWIAGYDQGPPEEAETVGVIPISGARCGTVPHTAHQSDEVVGFTADSKNVIVARSDFVPNNGPTGSSSLIQYAINGLQPSSGCAR